MSMTAAARPLSASLRRSRPGLVVLELVLPEKSFTGVGSFPACEGEPAARQLSREHLSALLADILRGKAPLGDTEEELSICAESRMISFGGKVIDNLTGREFALLAFLVSGSPRIFSRAEIISRAWKTVAVENLVDTHICNLRRKLPPGLAARIQSVPGRGFRYSIPVELD